MLGFRPSFRAPQLLGLLIFFNAITLFVLYSQKFTQSSFFWTSQDTFVLQPVDDELRNEGLATKVITVTAAPTPIATPKVPGPDFCDSCGPDDAMCTKYGSHNLARSRLYEGSNARFRRVISNAMAGKPIKIGVLGGSVSKGHGLTRENFKWLRRFEAAWKELFPKSETTMINGAVAATGSDYFSMCFGEHIPEDVDLVLVELLINDQRLESNAIAFEWLMRGLLDLPNSPAVINIHTIGLFFEEITTGGDLHAPIAAYYDAPVISMRNMIAPHILKHHELVEHYFYIYEDSGVDLRHVSNAGHIMMSELLVAYTQRQICAIELERVQPNRFVSEDGRLEGHDELGTVPRLRLFQKYDNVTVTGRIKPTCQSTRTNKHPLVPIETKGWKLWTHNGNNEKPYLMADKPGDYVKFEVEVGVMQRVRITYLRAKTFGLGNVWCWVDDDQPRTPVQGWWDIDGINVAQVAVISTRATPGKHNLTCEVAPHTADPKGGHQFRLIAIDAS
ncbi:hypothetical protein BU17DRAFT_54299 [Hysterangium stoloniferum]|nr:hypothetical protein BU17DRAFT_54299 [Hysterangium stoloniferum]